QGPRGGTARSVHRSGLGHRPRGATPPDGGPPDDGDADAGQVRQEEAGVAPPAGGFYPMLHTAALRAGRRRATFDALPERRPLRFASLFGHTTESSHAEDEVQQRSQEALRPDRDRPAQAQEGVREPHPHQEVAEAEAQPPRDDAGGRGGREAHQAPYRRQQVTPALSTPNP